MSETDPRFLRTRHRLSEAAFSLAERQDITSVTVSQIAREAGIDRSTFYLHYASKTAFLDALGEALLREFTEAGLVFESHKVLPDKDALPKNLPNIFWITSKHPAFYRQLLNGSASSTFNARLEDLFEDQFNSIWRQLARSPAPANPPLAFRARFAASATIGLLRLWLEHGDEHEVEQFAAWMWEYLKPLWLSSSTLHT